MATEKAMTRRMTWRMTHQHKGLGGCRIGKEMDADSVQKKTRATGAAAMAGDIELLGCDDLGNWRWTMPAAT